MPALLLCAAATVWAGDLETGSGEPPQANRREQPSAKTAPDFRLKVAGREIACRKTRVYHWRNPLRPAAFPPGSAAARFAERFPINYASFAHIECEDPVKVRVACMAPVGKVAIRPLSYRIGHEVEGDTIVFIIQPGQKVSVEPHGDTGPVLHIFADMPEEDVPGPGDPNVLYFGPGVHERASIELKDNQTLYLAPGAILKAIDVLVGD